MKNKVVITVLIAGVIFSSSLMAHPGDLDPSFGKGGKVVTDLSQSDSGLGVKAVANGQILVCGGGNVIRYNHDGTIDSTFGTNGVVQPASITQLANLTGSKQVVAVRPASKKSKTVFIKLQNDGDNTDSFSIKGPAGNQKIGIQYLNGTADVSADIIAGTFNTGDITTGGSFNLTVNITSATKLANQARNFLVQATSTGDSTKRDTTLIKAKSAGL